MTSIAIDHWYINASLVDSKRAFKSQKHVNNGTLDSSVNSTVKSHGSNHGTQPIKPSPSATLSSKTAAPSSYDDICEQYSQKLLSHLHLKPAAQNMDLPEIKKALKYAKEYHKGQKRESGEPYFMHPVEVAILVSDYVFDQDAIIAAVLHDILEDTNFSQPMMGLLFGEKVVNAVCALSNSRRQIKLCEETSLAILYKAGDDVITIKLCDRLHNMRTIEHMPLHKQKKKALQTLRTFVPLAKYLGIKEIEDELTQICNNVLSIY